MEIETRGKYRAYAALRVFGKGLSPDNVTGMLSVSPSRTGGHGEVGAWSYTTKDVVKCEASLEDHLWHIVRLFAPAREALGRLSQQYTVEALCYLGTDGDVGGFGLSVAVLKALSDLNVSLYVDIFFMLGDEASGTYK